MSNSSIQPIDRALSSATTLGQSGPGSNDDEGVLHIPQSSSITIRLFSIISRTLFGWKAYPSTEMQLVYSTSPADGASESEGRIDYYLFLF